MLLAAIPSDFDAEWAPALVIVKKLLNRENVTKREWHDLFAINNRITSWVPQGSSQLLNALNEVLIQHVRDAGARIRSQTSDEGLIRVYVLEWENYSVLIEHLPTPFAFVERGAMRQNGNVSKVEGRQSENLYTVRNMMYYIWRKCVFSYIHEKLLEQAMKIIENERSENGLDAPMEYAIGVRDSYVTAGLIEADPIQTYKEVFESRYISDLEDYYFDRTLEILDSKGIIQYMNYAYQMQLDEESRAIRYLHPCSMDPANEAIDRVLITRFEPALLAEGPRLIKSNDVEQLQKLFYLVDRTDNVKPLLTALYDHIRSEGLASIKQNAELIINDPEKYVDALLLLYDRFTEMVKQAFFNNFHFLTARDRAFQEVVNSTEVFKLELVANKMRGFRLPPESKCPELLANYCDLLLRKSALTKKLRSDEIDARLNKVLLLLKYVSNKDIFMRYYKNHLARRLILEVSSDQEKEENIVKLFRDTGMPSDYVNKLYRMLQDIEVNKDLSFDFRREYINEFGQMPLESVHLKILNAGAWNRPHESTNVSLPTVIEELLPVVEEFYKKKHVGRKLYWAHNWSTGMITFSNQRGKYDLEVSVYQMAILYCWNERPSEKLSYEALRVATQLSDLDLRRGLASLLTNPKVRIQVLHTDITPVNPKNFNDSTLFWINHDFAVVKNDKPQSRGRINLVNRLIMNQEPTEDEQEEIIRLREYRIQEAIVKIMKTARVIHQNELHNRLVDILKHMFAPSKKMIKEQVEWLIDNKFIERDPKNMEMFTYVA